MTIHLPLLDSCFALHRGARSSLHKVLATAGQAIRAGALSLSASMVMAAGLAVVAPALHAAPVVTEYAGTCDVSAAIALDAQRFVVASDEDNHLRIYKLGSTVAPLGADDVSKALKTTRKSPEADLEAAAAMGERIYWITSHGANSSGEQRSNRHRLFATQTTSRDGESQLAVVGKPYRDLVRDMARHPSLKPFDLGKAAEIAPKEPGGLNIEGLAATPDGHLLIGLRGPVPDGKALLIPVDNPSQVVAGKPALLGEPIWLALGGRGVRSIEYVPALSAYLIVAGLPGVGGPFELYRWSGMPTEAPVAMPGVDMDGLQPEAMIAWPGSPVRLQIFSDDGTRRIDGKMCKEQTPEKQRFRTIEVTL